MLISKSMIKLLRSLVLALCIGSFSSCSDYLDIVPDNIPTLDHAFRNRASAEKFLFTCYSYLPDRGNPNYNPEFFSGCENWIAPNNWWFIDNSQQLFAWNIAKGNQNTNSPLLDFWGGANGGKNLFVAIRDCNIFLENIDKPSDMDRMERLRWSSEVKYLKAYYHYYLLRMYGSIPIIRENLPVSSSPEAVRVYRDPFDDVVAYIVELLDEAYEYLPLKIMNETQEMGRITQPIALGLKAQVLTLAASPQFNGNPYYKDVVDNCGVKLFPQEEDKSKWEKAAVAIREAIDCAHEAEHELYYFDRKDKISDSTKVVLNCREAVTERWNPEIIWGSTNNDSFLQSCCAVRFDGVNMESGVVSMMSPTLDVAERYYTKNGVPINEDKEWDYQNRYKTKVATKEYRFYIKEGHETANLHFDREPRFYAALTFDGAMVYGNGVASDDPEDEDVHYAEMKKGQPGGISGATGYNITGYLPRKLVNTGTVLEKKTFTAIRGSFPLLRLADLYLLYAEVLNEVKDVPDAEVYKWIDLVRERAGLEGVEASWSKYSNRPDKPKTKDGMREIIHQERLIEFFCEISNYWDMRRWRMAETFMNQPIRGWNVNGEETSEYYEVKTIARPTFSMKNYLTPISFGAIEQNPNLVQNPGWE